jgi:hypothetical protein
LTWEQDSFAYADSYDEAAGRYKGLRGKQLVTLFDANSSALLVKSDVARKQLDVETRKPITGPLPPPPGGKDTPTGGGTGTGTGGDPLPPPPPAQPKRFHGTVTLNSTRVGRDASVIAEEVIAHLSGLVGSTVTVTLEIEADIPSGAPDQVVRTVTENSRSLKFTSQGFEKE